MEDEYCEMCGYKTYSKSKGRPVMCECAWNKLSFEKKREFEDKLKQSDSYSPRGKNEKNKKHENNNS